MGDGKDGAWDTRFEGEARVAFVRALEAAAERIGVHIDEDAAHATFGRVRVSLASLAEACAEANLREFEEILETQLRSLKRANEDAAEIDARYRDLEAIEDNLRLRLYRKCDVASGRKIARAISYTESTAGSRNAEDADLLAVLVCDEPDRIVTIDAAWSEGWNVPLDTVLDRAAAATAAEELSVDEFTLGDTRFRSLVGDGYYTASHALQLSRFIDPTEYGVLFAVPHRHAVLLHRIEDHHVVDAIESLLPVTDGMFGEGPGPISDELFWWRNGRVLRLPVARTDSQERKVRLPPSFVSSVLSPIMKARA